MEWGVQGSLCRAETEGQLFHAIKIEFGCYVGVKGLSFVEHRRLDTDLVATPCFTFVCTGIQLPVQL